MDLDTDLIKYMFELCVDELVVLPKWGPRPLLGAAKCGDLFPGTSPSGLKANSAPSKAPQDAQGPARGPKDAPRRMQGPPRAQGPPKTSQGEL